MNAKPGTIEMDELELLTALVEMYEDRHYPISPPDPIAAIKFRMDQLGLTQKDMEWHKFPVVEMVQRCWIPKGKDLKENAEELMRNFISQDDMTLAGLIPKKVWQKNPIRGKVTIRKVYDLAEELKVHPAIVAGRVRYERNNYKLLSRHVGRKVYLTGTQRHYGM